MGSGQGQVLPQLILRCMQLVGLTVEECLAVTTVTVPSTHLRCFALLLRSLRYKDPTLVPDRRPRRHASADHRHLRARSAAVDGKAPREMAAVTELIIRCGMLDVISS